MIIFFIKFCKIDIILIFKSFICEINKGNLVILIFCIKLLSWKNCETVCKNEMRMFNFTPLVK